jgi:glutamine synthetase
MESRTEIMLENYCKSVSIEANTMVQMAKTQIIPAIEKYAQDTAQGALIKKQLSASIECGYESTLVARLSELSDTAYVKTGELEQVIEALGDAKDIFEESAMIRDSVLPKMSELRAACDEAETLTAKSYWPFPTYSDLLFGV